MHKPKKKRGAVLHKSAVASLQDRKRHLRVHLWVGLCVLGLFTVFKIGLMHTAQGRWMAEQAYEWLHDRAREDKAELPVVLVDISDLKPQRLEGPEGDTRPAFTPRSELGRLLSKIARLKQEGLGGPVAVGFDLDFSAEPDGFIPPESFHFFDLCVTVQSNGLPVALGVRRMETMGEGAWLGTERYSVLAASISRPKGPVRQMPFVYQFGDSTRPLPTLSGALADHFRKSQSESSQKTHGWFSWVAEELAEVTPLADLAKLKYKSFLVDYSRRRELEQSALGFQEVVEGPASMLAPRLNGKIIIVGDVRGNESQDMAIIPNEPEPVPGVFAQGCAVYTLIRAPMYVLNHWVGLGIAVALSLGAILLVHAVSWRYVARMEVSPIPLQLLLAVILFGTALLMAWLLMVNFRVLWLEVFAVLFILMAHTFVEVFIGTTNWKEAAQGRRGILSALIKKDTLTHATVE